MILRFRFFFLVWMLATPVFGHPVSLSWARVNFQEDHILVSFKILAEDLVLFYHVKPLSNDTYSSSTLTEYAQNHYELIQDHFFITTSAGIRLSGDLVSINTKSFPVDEIDRMDLMRYEILYQFKYSYDNEITKFTFQQEFSKHKTGIPALTFLSAYKAGEALVENQEISFKNPYTLNLNIKDPSNNQLNNSSSFITIHSTGVRHEFTIPYHILRSLINNPGADEKAVFENIQHYFILNNPVFVNKENLVPELRFLKFMGPEMEGPPAKIEEINSNSLIYIDLYYPSSSVPENTSILWEDFNWKLRWFPAEINAFDVKFMHKFSRFKPLFEWQIPPEKSIEKPD